MIKTMQIQRVQKTRARRRRHCRVACCAAAEANSNAAGTNPLLYWKAITRLSTASIICAFETIVIA